MADDFSLFSIIKLQGGYMPCKEVDDEELLTEQKEVPIFGIEDSGEVHPFRSDIGQLPDLISEPRVPMMPNSYKDCTKSSELLNYFGRVNIKSRKENLNNVNSEVTESGRKLSTEEIMRVAGERYIQFSSKKLNGVTTFIHPFGSALSRLSQEETRGVDLAHLLLAAAEKVGNKQFDIAETLLSHCEYVASDSGNPVERVAYYFTEALRERIKRETGIFTSKKVTEQIIGSNGLSTGADLTILASYKEVPFDRVIQFGATQAILDNVAMASKVHLVDLQIRSGIHLIGLMQALSEPKGWPIELLKVTAVATTGRQNVEGTGKRLQDFAKSLNMPFSFEVVFISDMKDINEKLFDIKVDETVAVYSPSFLRTLISRPDQLENLMRVIQSLRPSIMVVSEVEASDNSPSFVNRFIESLFFYSAYFDCFEDCMDRDSPYRIDLERNHYGKGIKNTLATEGEERIIRSVKINVWRAFFARFQMEEVELSTSSLSQASLVLEQQFSCGSSCTLDNNGKKCLIVGWKGTPLRSLSAWKFN